MRKAAMEEIMSACERSGHYIEANKVCMYVRMYVCMYVGSPLLTESFTPPSPNSHAYIHIYIHTYIINQATAEILKGLRVRLSDTQANLKPLAAQAIADVLVSLDDQVCM